ncbi:HalOD1 output domain-containing protein [Halovivax cerinus]|uniref:HalOD1 output domain-containing protein n=1 Tax=Halovivax cerinus TaxID=1487865 RepID=A0ABD5NLL3_9EURY|nr:HalOD1 output domain-containing protein [Halovivax cerinus]
MGTSPRTSHAMPADDALSHRVVYAIAEREGVEPEALEPPLYSAIDPEALDLLYESADESLTVSFSYLGYDVHVDADGTVSVDP